MTERGYATSHVSAKMANDLSPRKTMVVLVIVAGCFAVLWPVVFYPMLAGSASQHMKPSPIDKTTGCCDVISETDVNTIKIMSELCGTIIKREDDAPLTGREIVSKCRSAVLETCGIDISAVLQEQVKLGQTVKQILDEVRSLNGSLCLKYNFGVAPWRLGVPHRVTVSPPGPSIRQERPLHLRSEVVHPAFRERGSAIAQPQPSVPVKAPKRVVEGRPGPVPAMRPTLGGAGHVVPPPKHSTGNMGLIMPIYTIGIVIFFTYTIMKIIFKKQPEALYPPVEPDPHFRREVFESEKGHAAPRLTREGVSNKLVVNAMSALLDEVDQEIESRRREVADQDVVANGKVVSPPEEDQPTVKVLGMEMTASCEGGKKWSRPDSPVLPASAPPAPEPTEPPQEIFLEGALPPQSHLLVADSATEAQKTTSEEDPAVVLAGKMTLSVISLDSSENGADESSKRSSSNVSEEFEKIDMDGQLEEQINSIIEQAQATTGLVGEPEGSNLLEELENELKRIESESVVTQLEEIHREDGSGLVSEGLAEIGDGPCLGEIEKAFLDKEIIENLEQQLGKLIDEDDLVEIEPASGEEISEVKFLETALGKVKKEVAEVELSKTATGEGKEDVAEVKLSETAPGEIKVQVAEVELSETAAGEGKKEVSEVKLSETAAGEGKGEVTEVKLWETASGEVKEEVVEVKLSETALGEAKEEVVEVKLVEVPESKPPVESGAEEKPAVAPEQSLDIEKTTTKEVSEEKINVEPEEVEEIVTEVEIPKGQFPIESKAEEISAVPEQALDTEKTVAKEASKETIVKTPPTFEPELLDPLECVIASLTSEKIEVPAEIEATKAEKSPKEMETAEKQTEKLTEEIESGVSPEGVVKEDRITETHTVDLKPELNGESDRTAVEKEEAGDAAKEMVSFVEKETENEEKSRSTIPEAHADDSTPGSSGRDAPKAVESDGVKSVEEISQAGAFRDIQTKEIVGEGESKSMTSEAQPENISEEGEMQAREKETFDRLNEAIADLSSEFRSERVEGRDARLGPVEEPGDSEEEIEYEYEEESDDEVVEDEVRRVERLDDLAGPGATEHLNGDDQEQSKYVTTSSATLAENDISDEENLENEDDDEEEEIEEIIEYVTDDEEEDEGQLAVQPLEGNNVNHVNERSGVH